MEFDLENTGTWFDYGNGRVCLRTCPSIKLTEFKKKANTKITSEVVFDKTTRAAQRIQTEKVGDEELYNKLLWDYIIADWEGMTVKGEEFKAITDNKILAMNSDVKFATFVTKCLQTLNSLEIGEEVTASKNS